MFNRQWPRTVAAIALCVLPLLAAAGGPIDGAGLRADVDLLQRAYTSLHPGLYRYATPEQVAARFDALRAELGDGATLAQAYLAFSRFAGSVRCGHTYPNFYNQSEAVQAALFDGGARVPFQFRWREGRMLVTRDLTGRGQLPPGTEVLAIDGIDTSRMLAAMMPHARADGGNDAKRRAYLEVRGEDDYEAFDIYLSLLYPQIGPRQRLQVRLPGARRTRTVTVQALDLAQRRAARVAPAVAKDGPAWTLSRPRAGVARLHMPTWALYNSDWDWRAWLDAQFDTLAADGTRALVIDLRGNEGGVGVGDAILARLASAPIELPKTLRLVRYRKVDAALAPHLDTWDRSFLDWGDDAVPHDADFFRLTRWDKDGEANRILPARTRFTGRVFVLVGATNSSATFEFARQARDSGLATLVGQPTGGNLRGINGGAFFFLRLPNSGIEMDLPLVGQFPREPQPDAGLRPDIAVDVSPDDIARGRDAELAAVLAVLDDA